MREGTRSPSPRPPPPCPQARSYKKELIIFSFNRATALEAVNFVFNLRDLGYDHWLALTDDSTMCEVMRTAFPNGGQLESPGWGAGGGV